MSAIKPMVVSQRFIILTFLNHFFLYYKIKTKKLHDMKLFASTDGFPVSFIHSFITSQ